MSDTRVELTLDSGHALPAVRHGAEPAPDQREIEVKELQRLYKSSLDPSRRAALHTEINKLMGVSPLERGGECVTPTRSSERARPWSARPMSARKASVQIMKTISETKQHVRPLSSKVRGVSETGSLGSAEKKWGDAGVRGGEPVRGGDSSAQSSVSRDSLGSEDGTADELDRYEITRIWSSCYDARNPIGNVVDRNSATFWVTSGLFPHTIGLHFRRTIALCKVTIYCQGVSTLRLSWLSPQREGWCNQSQSLGPSTAPDSSMNEFVFTIASGEHSAGLKASAVTLELTEAHDAFAIVRHVNFVEHCSLLFAARNGCTAATRPNEQLPRVLTPTPDAHEHRPRVAPTRDAQEHRPRIVTAADTKRL